MQKYGILFSFVMLCGLTGLYGQLGGVSGGVVLPDEMPDEMPGGMPGGLQGERPADDEVKAVVNDPKIRAALRAKAKESNVIITQLTPIKYAKQTVGGTNYFVKIRIGKGPKSFIHARIYKGMYHDGNKLALHGLDVNKSARDQIDYVKQFGEI